MKTSEFHTRRRFGEFSESEWREVKLESICETMVSGGTPSTQVAKYWGGTIPWITGADFASMKIAQIRRYITEEAVANSATKVIKKGDILAVTRTGVGKVAIAPFDVAISQDTTGITPKADVVDAHYLLFALIWTIPQLARFNQGTSINGVTRRDLKRHKIPLPPLSEQRRIAEILGEWDNAITLTKRLIEAKQRRKKGLMQQLLTGRRRFGEFVQSEDRQPTKFSELPADWDIVHIEDIAQVNTETVSEKSDPNHTYFYIDLSSVNKGMILFPQKSQRFRDLPSRARRVLHKGDVIMATVRPNLLGFAVCDFQSKDILCSTGFALISPKKITDANFIYQNLYGDVISRQIKALVTGSNYPAINSTDVKKLKLFWSKFNAERSKIAAVLSACDAEIELLGRKLSALKQQKKGLMQRLLTGKVRV